MNSSMLSNEIHIWICPFLHIGPSIFFYSGEIKSPIPGSSTYVIFLGKNQVNRETPISVYLEDPGQLWQLLPFHKSCKHAVLH